MVHTFPLHKLQVEARKLLYGEFSINIENFQSGSTVGGISRLTNEILSLDNRVSLVESVGVAGKVVSNLFANAIHTIILQGTFIICIQSKMLHK